MSFITTILVTACLLGFVVLGVGLLVWLAPVQTEQMTPAQNRLLDIADWMTKASVGALLGFAGGRFAVGKSNSVDG